MTKRVVSLMGAAGVAAMVILAGCSSGPGAVDHTAALDGTWTVTTMATVPNPDPTGASPTIQAPAMVTATIVDGPGVNTGTFSLTVTIGPVVTTGNGTLTAESASVLKVTLNEIMGPSVPATVTALKGVEQTLNYELKDNTLKISSDLFATLGVAMELTLTKQMASS